MSTNNDKNDYKNEFTRSINQPQGTTIISDRSAQRHPNVVPGTVQNAGRDDISFSKNYEYGFSDYDYDYIDYESDYTTNSKRPLASLYRDAQNLTITGGTPTTAGRNMIDFQTSRNYTYQSQVTTNSNRPNASLYEGVQNVTINGGTHTNAGRNIIDIQSSGNYDAARVQKDIYRAGRLTDKYGKSAGTHAYTAYRDGTINVDRVENTPGGKFTLDFSDRPSKFDTSAKDWEDDHRQEDSDRDVAKYIPKTTTARIEHVQPKVTAVANATNFPTSNLKMKCSARQLYCYAENAYKHATQSKANLHELLAEFQIISYVVGVGFNEEMITRSGTHVEEIIIRVSDPTVFDVTPTFLEAVGKILSPFPGHICIGDTDSVATPIFDDKLCHKLVDFNEYILRFKESAIKHDGGPCSIAIKLNSSEDQVDQEELPGSSQGGTGEGSEFISKPGQDGRSKEGPSSGSHIGEINLDKGKEVIRDAVGEEEGKGKNLGSDRQLHKVILRMDAFLSEGADRFMEDLCHGSLSMHVELTSDIRQSHSFDAADIEFKYLRFQQKTMDMYYQRSCAVVVDSKYLNAVTHIIKPHRTLRSDGERQRMSNEVESKSSSNAIAGELSGSLAGIAGKISDTDTSTTTNTKLNQHQFKEYTSRIRNEDQFGKATWTFDIEDPNARIDGAHMLDDKLPQVEFDFSDPKHSRPEKFTVEVSSYWSLINQDRSNEVLLLNFRHTGYLEAPYNLSEYTLRSFKQERWKEGSRNEALVDSGGDLRVETTPFLVEDNRTNQGS